MIETVWSGVTWKSGDIGVTNLQFSGIWSEVNTRLFEQYLARQSLVLLLLRICHALTHATLWEFIIKFFVELSHSANNDQSYLHFIQIPECLNLTRQIFISSYFLKTFIADILVIWDSDFSETVLLILSTIIMSGLLLINSWSVWIEKSHRILLSYFQLLG